MRYKRINFRAEITVFLTLLFGIVSALVLTVIESARNQATRVQVERVMQTAIHSCFSEYNQDLLKYYEIFAIDSSYRKREGNIDNIRKHLEDYAAENFSSKDSQRVGSDWLKLTVNESSLSQYELLSDNHGRPMLNQINEYMSGENTVKDGSEYSSIGELLYPKTDEEFMTSFAETLSLAGGIDNPAEKIFEIAGNTNLTEYILSDYDYRTISDSCPSKRNLEKGTYLAGNNTKRDTAGNSEYLDSYIMNHFSNCIDAFDHSYLGAETEYIVTGKNREKDSIRDCAKWILAQRESKNLATMEGNIQVLKDTEELSDLLCENGDGDRYYTQLSLIYAWTYVESLVELNCLYNGGRINLSEGIESPKVPLSGILDFTEYFGNIYGSGQNYHEILSGMIGHINERTKIMRMMDIIEENLIHLGHEGFRADKCVTYFKARIVAESEYGHGCEIEREYGYCTE